MRARARWTVAVLGTGALVAATAAVAVAASVATGPTGDPQAIAFAQQVQAAYASIPVETVKESGFVAMDDEEGRQSFFDWAWGSATIPHGWVRARESAAVGLRAGKVAWWRDDLTPPPCHAAGFCNAIPVEVVIDRAGAFFSFGDAARHTCFGRLKGDTPTSVGAPWYVVRGAYGPLASTGTSVLLSYSYPWGRQTASEMDTVSAADKLDRWGVIHISGGGERAFTVRFTDTHPARAPKPPKVDLCRA